MKSFRVFEAFAGYGGAHFALKRLQIPYKVIGYSELDKWASELYECNHPGVKPYGDITSLDPSDIEQFNLFTGGFPCQPFSNAGIGLGIKDTRGTLFHEILRICEFHQPENILLENVKGLVTKRHKSTLDTITKKLAKLMGGLNHVHIQLINSLDYGIPQNRERVWIYASKKEIPKDFDLAPQKMPLKAKFKDFLDVHPDPSLFLTQAQIKHLEFKHNIELKTRERVCFDIYNKKLKKEGICMTLTEPHHNATRVVYPRRNGIVKVRKLSKEEHFRLMGFENDEIKFNGQSYQQICKRAGNGWDINVAQHILKTIHSFYYG